MKELRVTDWRAFQHIGCYWMKHVAKQLTGRSIDYVVYGSDGEGQGGVDLIPRDSTISIVGQSKCWTSKGLTWGKIEEELQKTERFNLPISVYIILTNATRHTSVQQQMPNDATHYQRTRDSFEVRIYYWEELQNLDFVPQYLLQKIFPSSYALSAPSMPDPSLAKLVQSLQHSRSFLPSYIPHEHLEWLETWDFKKGYVLTEHFDFFRDIRIDIDRTLKAMENSGLREWLVVGKRIELSMCLPAAAELFTEIEIFVDEISSQTVPMQLEDGTWVYACGHDNQHAESQITYRWKVCASTLLNAYRKVILGNPTS